MSDRTPAVVKLCECGCGKPAPIAKRSNKQLGHVKGQPIRFIVGHSGFIRRSEGPTVCSIEGCENKVRARGWCSAHWWRWRHNGSPHAVTLPRQGCEVDGCDSAHFGLGLCVKHHARLKRNGTTDPGPMAAGSPEERFWRHVRKADGCWLWTAWTNNNGYGTFGGGQGKMRVYAHRFSYELHKGEIPKGLHVLHSCDVPACVNPDHLRAGTALDNLGEAAAKGRVAHGERNGHAKLTAQQVAEIRARSMAGQSYSQIAAIYGVSCSQVGRIVTRKAWARVT